MIDVHLFQCKLVSFLTEHFETKPKKKLCTCQMVVQVNTRTATTLQICAIMRTIFEFQRSGISLLLLMVSHQQMA